MTRHRRRHSRGRIVAITLRVMSLSELIWYGSQASLSGPSQAWKARHVGARRLLTNCNSTNPRAATAPAITPRSTHAEFPSDTSSPAWPARRLSPTPRRLRQVELFRNASHCASNLACQRALRSPSAIATAHRAASSRASSPTASPTAPATRLSVGERRTFAAPSTCKNSLNLSRLRRVLP